MAEAKVIMEKDATKKLAQYFIERATALGLKGKRRDDAALTYFLGAAALAEINGDGVAYNRLGTVAALLIAPQGYAAVLRIASEE